jgi:hypothetical protein
MARGLPKRVVLGANGAAESVYGQFDIDIIRKIYTVSATKDDAFDIGDTVVLPDGREYVYCLSSGACYTGQGNAIKNAIPATGIDYANNVAAAAAIGDTEVVITNGSTVVQTLDGLRGGFILLKAASGSGNEALQQRRIIGNSAAGLAADCTIYLDAPLTAALTTSSYAFCMPSPYSAVALASSGNEGIIGPAATYVSASGKYFFCQYKGRCWLAPQSTVGVTQYGREVVWRHDGSIQLRDYSSAIGGEYGQVAGYIVDCNDAANGATEICLTGAI